MRVDRAACHGNDPRFPRFLHIIFKINASLGTGLESLETSSRDTTFPL